MPTTRKQKKARKSRGIEMLSDIENLDIMLGENHSSSDERDESTNSNQARRSGSASGDEFENNGENNHLDIGSFGPGTSTNHGQNSTGGNASAEINRLSSELNSRLSRELDEMMSSVNTQIQRAISDAISGQILPQIQSVLNAGSGQPTLNKWNVPSERPGMNSEETYGEKTKKNNRSEQRCDYPIGSQPNLRAYDRLITELLLQNLLVVFFDVVRKLYTSNRMERKPLEMKISLNENPGLQGTAFSSLIHRLSQVFSFDSQALEHHWSRKLVN